MAKFNNTVKQTTKTTNLSGGSAYTQDPREELATLVATSMLKKQYYRTESETLTRIKHLVDTIPDKKFIAKAAIWGRHTMGMRSVSHAVSAYLAPHLSGTDYGAKFYKKVCRIGQDATEIVTAYVNLTGAETLSMAMKKGLKAFIESLDLYSLQKYLQEGHEVNMYDLINLTHAKSDAITELKRRSKAGEIVKTTNEAKVSQAKAEGGEAVSELYNDMLSKNAEGEKGGMGYLALIRNLNTMLKEDGINLDNLFSSIENQEAVLKSKVFPFQILTAMYYLLDIKNNTGKDIAIKINKTLASLNKALELSLPNAKPLEGKTLVALDTSGSMQGRAIEIASMFAAILAKTDSNADIMTFGSRAQYESVNLLDSVMTIAKALNTDLGGTDFSTVFTLANKHYDNIIILTDNESYIGDTNNSVKQFVNKFGIPKIYTIQFEAYGTSQFSKNGYNTTFAGYNDKVFEMISNAKSGTTLIKEIEAVDL